MLAQFFLSGATDFFVAALCRFDVKLGFVASRLLFAIDVNTPHSVHLQEQNNFRKHVNIINTMFSRHTTAPPTK